MVARTSPISSRAWSSRTPNSFTGPQQLVLGMDMTLSVTTLIFLVALALAFDFLNGFHDAANSIATVVSTGVLRPYQAVAWAACFNFVAFAIFKLNVASTVGKG